MSTLYVLQLEGGKYYVGRTDDINRRYSEHKLGKGSEWTKLHKPLKLLETHESKTAEDETKLTKFLMQKFGVENVRGGAYCQRELPEYVEEMIKHENRSNSDRCYKCGKPGHFANQCKRKSSFKAVCECGEEFLEFDEFITHMKGCKVRNKQVYSCQHCNKQYDYENQAKSCQCKFAKIARMTGRQKLIEKKSTQTGKCYRCGRFGHWSSSCYAKTDVDGNDLTDDEDYESE